MYNISDTFESARMLFDVHEAAAIVTESMRMHIAQSDDEKNK